MSQTTTRRTLSALAAILCVTAMLFVPAHAGAQTSDGAPDGDEPNIENDTPQDETPEAESPAPTSGKPFDPAFGSPAVDIEVATNGVDADTLEEAPALSPGSTVTWTYVVTNIGDTSIYFEGITDSMQGTCIDPANVVAYLGVGESVTCELTGIVGDSNYANTATVVAHDAQSSAGETVTDTDPSHYTIAVTPTTAVPIPTTVVAVATTVASVPAPTTTAVAVGSGPTSTTSVIVKVGANALPFTGRTSGIATGVALVLIGCGGVLLFSTRREEG